MENIQVALRVRPLSKKEIYKGEENVWSIAQNNTISLQPNFYRDMISTKRINFSSRVSFPFDYVFAPEENNLQVYNSVVKRIALSSLNGINGTVFMYGQTGSGKTYSMMGYRQDETDNSTTTTNTTTTTTTTTMSNGGVFSTTYGNIPTSPKLQGRTSYMKSPNRFEEKTTTDNNNNNTNNATGEDCIESFDKPNFLTNDTSSTGILIQALRDIFNAIENDLDKTYFLRCSYVEIYNDQIFDLLKSHDKLGETLTVNEDPKRDFYIKGVIEESVSSISEILDKLRKGETNRHYAATMMNHSSSRSHTIFRLSVQTVTNNFIRDYRRECFKLVGNVNNDELKTQLVGSSDNTTNGISNVNLNTFSEETLKREGTMVTESLLNFVDLAGSEKVSNHHLMLDDPNFRETTVSDGSFHGKDIITKNSNIKDRVKEGQHINKSLFFLTQVISLKSEGKPSQHIPYRNSPLTKILRSSLGGNSRTLIILCMTPAGSQLDQTMSTLRFGMNAKKIENKVQANIITNNDDEALKILIADYEKKIRDFENNRQEDQHKYHSLLRQIEELQQQKAKIIERFNNLCKIQLNKFVESISDAELKTFFSQIQDRFIYFDRVGLLFNSSKLTKYDKILSHGNKKSRTNMKKAARKARVGSRAEIEDESVLGDGYPQAAKPYTDDIDAYSDGEDNKGGQDLIFDSQGKYALHAYKAMKRQNGILLKKIGILEDVVKKCIKRCIINYEGIFDYANLYKQEYMKVRDYGKRLCDQIQESMGLNKMVNLYKDLKGIKKLNDEELYDLEKRFLDKIDEIKSEKMLRQYTNEINDLRNKLHLPIIDNNENEDELANKPWLLKQQLIKNELDSFQIKFEKYCPRNRGDDLIDSGSGNEKDRIDDINDEDGIDSNNDDIGKNDAENSADNKEKSDNTERKFILDYKDDNDYKSLKDLRLIEEEQSIWNEYYYPDIEIINKEYEEALKSMSDYKEDRPIVPLPKQRSVEQTSHDNGNEGDNGKILKKENKETVEDSYVNDNPHGNESSKKQDVMESDKSILLKLDLGLSIIDYQINMNKYSIETQNTKNHNHIHNDDDVNNTTSNIYNMDTPNRIHRSHDHEQKLEVNTTNNEINDIESMSNYKMTHNESNLTINSASNLNTSKQISPSPYHHKKKSVDNHGERLNNSIINNPTNSRNNRANSASLQNSISKDSMESFYSSASKSNLMKQAKPKISQNSPGIPKAKKKSQGENQDYTNTNTNNNNNNNNNRSKPLTAVNLNTSNSNINSRKNSKSPANIYRSKSPVPKYYHSLPAKDKEQSISSDNNNNMQSLDTQNSKLKTNRTNSSKIISSEVINIIQDSSEKLGYLNDNFSTGRSSKIDDYDCIKSNKENQYDDKRQLGLSMQAIDIIDHDDISLSNSILPKQLKRNGSLDIDIIKLNPSFTSTTYLNSNNNSDGSPREDLTDLYHQHTQDHDTRKRRSRAERANKNKQ